MAHFSTLAQEVRGLIDELAAKVGGRQNICRTIRDIGSTTQTTGAYSQFRTTVKKSVGYKRLQSRGEACCVSQPQLERFYNDEEQLTEAKLTTLKGQLENALEHIPPLQ